MRNGRSQIDTGAEAYPLNGLCPYYTMFPIEFPLTHLQGINAGEWILDPFCGRGTTAFAARVKGLNTVGLDVNPVAVAIARAKLVSPKPAAILKLAERGVETAWRDRKPKGEFWERAFHPDTLDQILRLRAFLRTSSGPTADALRGVLLGALHGPQPKSKNSYLSNQMQRTFAPKPDYAINYWKRNRLRPRKVDVLEVVRERAARFYTDVPGRNEARILCADARRMPIRNRKFAATITSPPYFGMTTYVPDQWLRSWFLGGPSRPVYGHGNQLAQGDWKTFASALGEVWRQVAIHSQPDAPLIIRFGALPSREQDPEKLIRQSLKDSGMPWRISRIDAAGDANRGRRQGAQMGGAVRSSQAIAEIDVVCRLRNPRKCGRKSRDDKGSRSGS